MTRFQDHNLECTGLPPISYVYVYEQTDHNWWLAQLPKQHIERGNTQILHNMLFLTNPGEDFLIWDVEHVASGLRSFRKYKLLSHIQEMNVAKLMCRNTASSAWSITRKDWTDPALGQLRKTVVLVRLTSPDASPQSPVHSKQEQEQHTNKRVKTLTNFFLLSPSS